MGAGGATTAGDLVNPDAVCDHDDDAHNQDDYLSNDDHCDDEYHDDDDSGICGLPILERMLTVGDARYHPACFTCAQCGAGLEGGQFMEDGDVVICRDCYIRWIVQMMMSPANKCFIFI